MIETMTIDFDEMNRKVIAEFRENDGKVGGMFEGMPLVLVHHIGAKTGTPRISPLASFTEDGRIFIFGSKGGSDEHPAWYHNLVANPKITVELAAETYPAIARVLTGAERDDIYAKQSAEVPQFGVYQNNTKRVIPVIELERI